MATVALIGGFGAPRSLLGPLRKALVSAAHDVTVAPLGMNIDCGEATVARLEAWVERMAHGRPVAIVGHSRGGQLGRVVAVRRPDLVERLVTVVTPWSIGPPDRRGVRAATNVIRMARRAGLPVMASIECAAGKCCTEFRVDVARLPACPWVALWSSTDTVAGADAVPPDGVLHSVDTGTSHVGAVTSARGQQAVLAALEFTG